ncbi:hypothetical protein COW36_22605 [bacterium (Candidatus Blackallbacteria) CG17_big_fil_post_rev_8_21_14_2_50_48_46]|uniref:Type II secretion system protein GspE N-terminal domain-containing protein n=1 Tax=bacterium (Candidatus Blackallbacteria) CG17_big_fil_post_rev_8_21_14_2_50_48_46 TaxID=2014261 RepID=A0A2M7FZB1_9BACT|nr:MAG: hypothetical protein COW64_07375 [bacterium (Candidatus Blackallbacteria) CG18_big_fil_WC_8_21_14_2_50_49_26]PIW14170.1 MAG: hypothetical protein COW36_22605 [bacterium (Candidatus Blackallbacteria) CG17_big_fil_post_rev_8_21_14_2_50_48_46]PIW46711.1 MAG: hypothetical protein COW20_14880 [bacterium (Candidatus Blackallbacteria) CG13_big_fil_rev_8_21_14_2_50_49_14]
MKESQKTPAWKHLTQVERLGEVLLRDGKLKLKQFAALMEDQLAMPEKRIGDLAVEKGYISQDELLDSLLRQIHVSRVVEASAKELALV